MWEGIDMLVWLQLILPVMNAHSNESSIQLAGTACLYNLTKGPVGEQIHPHILREVVHTTLTAMNTFPTHAQVGVYHFHVTLTTSIILRVENKVGVIYCICHFSL